MRSKKAIYNIITNIILQLIVVVYGFIVPKIIIRNFGSDVNGLVSSIAQFLGYITLLESGFGPVVKSVLYKPIARKDKKTIADILKTSEKFFRNIAIIFLVYIVCLSILYPLLVKNSFEYIYTLSLIIIISISTFAEYYFGMTYMLYLKAEQENYIVSIFQIITYLISIALILIMTYFGFGIHLIKLISGIVFVLRPILQNFYVKYKFNISLKDANSNYNIQQKWDGLAQHVAVVIHNKTDVTLLTIFSTLAEVSVYSVYRLVANGVSSIVQTLINGIDSTFGDMIARNEMENLNKKYSMYETVYLTVTTIIYSCTLLLIVPFIRVYTRGITDINYIRELFSWLLIIGEYIYIVRLPYHYLIVGAGHFKATKLWSWIETTINVIISIILVRKYGIVGVAIGTIVAILVRTIAYIYYSNKNILKRNIWISVKKILVIVLETVLIIFVSNHLPSFEINSYINWFIESIKIFTVSCTIILSMNYMLYKNEFSNLFSIIKNIIKRRKG